MDRIMSEYVIIVHFHMKYTKIEPFSCHKVCVWVMKVNVFLSFHCSFIWGRVQGQICCVMLFICFTHGTKSIWIHSSPIYSIKKFVFKHNCFILFVLIDRQGQTERNLDFEMYHLEIPLTYCPMGMNICESVTLKVDQIQWKFHL